jgi:hypothetical protein
MATDPVAMTNQDPAFYPTLGPFLARHEVHQALGGVPWDTPTKTWLVIKDATGAVIALCGIDQGTRRTIVESLYTLPGHEDQAPHLLAAAVKTFGHDRDLHTTVRHHLVPAHQAAGFHPVKDTTNFTQMVRPAAIRKTPAK